MEEEPASAVADDTLAAPELLGIDEVPPTTERVLLDASVLPTVDNKAFVDKPLGTLETLDEGDLSPRIEEAAPDASALPVGEEVVTPNMVAEPLDTSEVAEDEAKSLPAKPLDASASTVVDELLGIAELLEGTEPSAIVEGGHASSVEALLGVVELLVSDVLPPGIMTEEPAATVGAVSPPVIGELFEESKVVEGNEVSPTIVDETIPPAVEEEFSDVVEEVSLMTVGKPLEGAELLRDSKASPALVEEVPSTTTDEPVGGAESVEDKKAPPLSTEDVPSSTVIEALVRVESLDEIEPLEGAELREDIEASPSVAEAVLSTAIDEPIGAE